MSEAVNTTRAVESEKFKAFYEEKHITFIKKIASDKESFEFVVSQQNMNRNGSTNPIHVRYNV